MSDPLSPVLRQQSTDTSPGQFARFAATVSLLAPLIVIFICIVLFVYLQSHGGPRLRPLAAIGLLALLLIVLGLALGIVALAQTERHRRKGILGKAIAGICVNGLFLVLLVLVPILLAPALSTDHPRTPQGRLDKALNALATAPDQQRRFYALDDAAKASFVVGNIDDARRFAMELLELAPKFRGDWNYGNAIQDGNLVLGRIAVREGRIGEGTQYLLAAGKSPGSPQMNSFGPNMSFAKDLLEKGERDIVPQYFELSRRFWKMDVGKLDSWTEEVRAGKIPDFGANLFY